MKRTTSWLFALALALVAAPGCSKSTCRTGTNCGSGTTPPTATGTLQITPATAMLTVSGGPATQQFAATLGGEDVTTKVQWNIADKKAGSISQGVFTSNYPLEHGGPVDIQAVMGNQVAGASITLNYVAPDVIDKGASQNAPQAFGGPPSQDPAETPRIVYPFDGVMLARNINQMNIQWQGSASDGLFRIHIVGSNIDSSFYVGAAACSPSGKTSQCQYQPTDSDWQAIAISSAGGPASITVSGTAGNGQPVADSIPISLNFSPEDVKGGLYYFSPSISGLKRLPFGATQALDFVKQGSGYSCTGCHAVSRDGKKVASTFYGGDGTGGMVDGANGQKFLVRPEAFGGSAVKRWNFATFSPDGSLLLTSWAGVLTLRDGNTGAKKFDVSPAVTGGKAVMPEWSPDGTQVAFVQLPPEGKLGKDFPNSNLVAGDWDLGNAGSIAVMKYDSGEFQPAMVVVPSVMTTEYHYFPTWSPDSQWIAFVTAKWPGSSPTAGANLFGYSGAPSPKGYVMSYDQDTARLRLVQAAGGTVIELQNATHAMNKTTSWPKFAPFIQQAGSLVFFTFSAKFDYGWVVQNDNQVDPTMKTPQLWMSAIDLKRASTELGGTDPSYPPFWLPFQNPKEKNHSGIWTQEVVCGDNSDCPSEFSCQNGMCVPVIPG